MGSTAVRAVAALTCAALIATAPALAAASPHSGPGSPSTPATRAIPVGGPPTLPYLDVPNHRIVDGSRQIDVAGLQGTVVRLFKVDGGYVLGRRAPGNRSDLAFVTTTGARRVLTDRWLPATTGTLEDGVEVSHDGDRIVFNTRRTATEAYRDTAVLTVPGGHVTDRRTFSLRPRLMALGAGRVLMSLHTYRSTQGRVLWWTPGRQAVAEVVAPAAADAADLTAGAFVVRRPQQGVRVEGIPPRSTPHWAAGDDYLNFGSWSPDDRHLAGTDEIIAGTEDVELYHLSDAVTGEDVADLHVLGVPEITWESDDAVLIRSGESQDGFRMIRCDLDEQCEWVGDLGTRYAPYVVASRRTS